ncbi:MAG: S-layer homology domain-containing protein [Thermincola sp.]|jgi:hypothetical protein|nr:S-layer homology domain-containing protein [Thermincola sp.]MDT3703483.1 S-layer homology domain-containing protein [Thermincola sp.]
MWKKRLILITAPLLVGFMLSQAVTAAGDLPGSENNPVITKSYADKVFQPLNEQIAALQAEVAQLKAALQPAFKDLPSTHWAYKDVSYMVSKQIVSGLGDGKFGTDNPARRSELAVMLVKALNLPVTDEKSEFKDVPESHWAYKYITAAQKAGIISGFPGGYFKPNDYVTRGQVAAMLAKAYALPRTGETAEFSDVPQTYWAYDVIQKLADNYISKGYEDKTFRPALLVRRAEVAVLLAKAMDPARRN